MINEARKQDETISEWIDRFKCHIKLYSSVLVVSGSCSMHKFYLSFVFDEICK